MDLLALFDEMIAKLQQGKAEIEAQKAASFAAGKAEGDKEGYDRGLAENKAMNPVGDSEHPGAEFTKDQVEEAKVAAASAQRSADVAEFQPQLDSLIGQVGELKAEMEAMKVQIDTEKAAKDSAMADLEALKSDFEAKVSAASEDRVARVKQISTEAIDKMVMADAPTAEEAKAKIAEV